MGKNNKKFIYKEVKEFINSLGYQLISEEYINNRTKLTIQDKDDYLYFVNLDKIKQYGNPERFHTLNLYTIQNIKLWCKLNNKPFELLSNDYKGNSVKLKWKCFKDGCREIFESTWADVFSGKGCGICAGKQIGLFNCLATKNQELASEWHPTKNSTLTPYNVTIGYEKTDIWWQCKTNLKHEWKATILSRHNLKNGCPYCSGRYPTEENNLLVNNPELCLEWNFNKNKKLPKEYCPNSGKKVWWKCKDCGHEWEAVIGDRNNNQRGCPECNQSKGEKECKRVLDLRDIYYIPQREFDGLIGLGGGNLSYDFYIEKYNLLIEYQGEQHERYIKGFHKSKKDFKKQQEHDRKKKEYALSNGYNFLEIWYWNFDNIEKILNETLLQK